MTRAGKHAAAGSTGARQLAAEIITVAARDLECVLGRRPLATNKIYSHPDDDWMPHRVTCLKFFEPGNEHFALLADVLDLDAARLRKGVIRKALPRKLQHMNPEAVLLMAKGFAEVRAEAEVIDEKASAAA